MARAWTFGEQIGAGFALVVALALGMGAVAVFALRSVVTSKDGVIEDHALRLVEAERLRASFEGRSAAVRAQLVLPAERFSEDRKRERATFDAVLGRLASSARGEEQQRRLSALDHLSREYAEIADRVIALRRAAGSPEQVSRAFAEQLAPKRQEFQAQLLEFIDREQAQLRAAQQASSEAAEAAEAWLAALAVLAVSVAAAVAIALKRLLGRQLDRAVLQVESSSEELQAAAAQQVAGSKEQSTALGQMSTTLSELLASSRQISESARHVSGISEDAASTARSGSAAIELAGRLASEMREQVDGGVRHMQELGARSTQIGVVIDIVSELAEQTNILSINAAIEAAGAGAAGARFGVVSDEIRKLADRVGSSADEIRALVAEVRGSVDGAAQATSSSSSAVEAGTRQFGEVVGCFEHIAAVVASSRDASRQIELATQQQHTAVEQVHVAIANAAQASRESEASSGQTLRTASELAALARGLRRIVEAKPRA